jgi:hypothetical protein
MKKYLFVGERRSDLAIKMNVTWVDKRLAAAQLVRALEPIGIKWEECDFCNVFEDDIEYIRNHKGIVVAMGRMVEKELKRNKIKHEFIYHPATRGTVRKTENYQLHVKQQIGHCV